MCFQEVFWLFWFIIQIMDSRFAHHLCLDSNTQHVFAFTTRVYDALRGLVLAEFGAGVPRSEHQSAWFTRRAAGVRKFTEDRAHCWIGSFASGHSLKQTKKPQKTKQLTLLAFQEGL